MASNETVIKALEAAMPPSDTIVVILAKGGSERNPGKPMLKIPTVSYPHPMEPNREEIGCRRLIDWTLESVAKMTTSSEKVVLSECPEILRYCHGKGGVTCINEANLCGGDFSGTLYSRVNTAVAHLELNRFQCHAFKYVVLASSDCPIRPQRCFDDAIGLLLSTRADIIQGVVKIPEQFHPFRAWSRRQTGDIMCYNLGLDHQEFSQNYPPMYASSGAVFAMKRQVLQQSSHFGITHPSQLIWPLVVPDGQVFEIDTPSDLAKFKKAVRQHEYPTEGP